MKDVSRGDGIQRRGNGQTTRRDHRAIPVLDGGMRDTTAFTSTTRVVSESRV